MAKAYIAYAHRASDGTIFVPSPVADVASANLAICRLDSDGRFVMLYDINLYANLNIASEEAKRLRDSYERALREENKEETHE